MKFSFSFSQDILDNDIFPFGLVQHHRQHGSHTNFIELIEHCQDTIMLAYSFYNSKIALELPSAETNFLSIMNNMTAVIRNELNHMQAQLDSFGPSDIKKFLEDIRGLDTENLITDILTKTLEYEAPYHGEPTAFHTYLTTEASLHMQRIGLKLQAIMVVVTKNEHMYENGKGNIKTIKEAIEFLVEIKRLYKVHLVSIKDDSAKKHDLEQASTTAENLLNKVQEITLQLKHQ